METDQEEGKLMRTLAKHPGIIELREMELPELSSEIGKARRKM